MPPRMEPGAMSGTAVWARPPAPSAGLGWAGPVSGLARDKRLSASPKPSQGSPQWFQLGLLVPKNQGAYRCGAAQDSHLLPEHPARDVNGKHPTGTKQGQDGIQGIPALRRIGTEESFAVEVDQMRRCICHPYFCFPGNLGNISRHDRTIRERSDVYQSR
jgi:hypothetical protein